MIHERSHCRTCGSTNLTLILDLGKTALANDFLTPEEVPNYKDFAAFARGAVHGLLTCATR